jgi:uncharacterized membrane protein YjgN (DUF898 family)
LVLLICFRFFVVVASSDQYKKLIEKIEGVLISLVVHFMIERTLRYCTVVVGSGRSRKSSYQKAVLSDCCLSGFLFTIYGSAYDGIRRPPSRRIVSPLNMGFSRIACTR